jgi:hypothetical protein
VERTQHDYEARKDRQDAGTASDEDNRLVKQYEKSGFVRAKGGPLTDPHSPVVDAGKYDGYTQRDAASEAKARGLTATGTRDEIVARLEKADDEAAETAKAEA